MVRWAVLVVLVVLVVQGESLHNHKGQMVAVQEEDTIQVVLHKACQDILVQEEEVHHDPIDLEVEDRIVEGTEDAHQIELDQVVRLEVLEPEHLDLVDPDFEEPADRLAVVGFDAQLAAESAGVAAEVVLVLVEDEIQPVQIVNISKLYAYVEAGFNNSDNNAFYNQKEGNGNLHMVLRSRRKL